jgi:phosphoglycolate phosphatase-like HAD superfamily hydrolase
VMSHSISSLLFDCDGVLLDSNRVKTEAFRRAALPYGEGAAAQLVEHHVANGGVSRYRKFEYFADEVLGGRLQSGDSVDAMTARFADAVQIGLRTCAAAAGLEAARQRMSGARWFVVSGSDQDELRMILNERGLGRLFDGGIFGSPTPKETILRELVDSGLVTQPALFIGDSRYDYEAACSVGLDFAFVSRWTEFEGWRDYCATHRIPWYDAVGDVLEQLGRSAGHLLAKPLTDVAATLEKDEKIS